MHTKPNDGRFSLPARKKVFDVTPRQRSNGRPDRKPRAWSHQDDLAAAKGRDVVLFVGNELKEGVLVDADQFTIKIDVSAIFGSQSILTYFKHALTGYKVL